MDVGLHAPLDRSHVAPITTREELIYLLTRAAELEHGLSCLYMFAAYSLKSDVAEGGITAAQVPMLLRWKRRLAAVAVEEMLHLAQVANILTAIGGAPHFARTNFPLPATAFPFGIKLSLEPFSRQTIERFVCYEMPEPGVLSPDEQAPFDAMLARISERATGTRHPAIEEPSDCYEPFDIDYGSQGEFYHKVMTAFENIPERELFIGPPEAQANARFLDFEGKLVPVTDSASARAAIEMIIEQGEAPTAAHPDAHFCVFDSIRREYEEGVREAEAAGTTFEPARPVISNPMTRLYDDTAGGTLITDRLTHDVADLFNVAYDTMLLMLMRFFAHTEETDAELEQMSRVTLRLMTTVLRPLGEALTKMPAGEQLAGMTAGPGFGYRRDIQLLPHKRAAWVFFDERLRQIAQKATRLCVAGRAQLPPEVEEAAAALQDLSERMSPEGGWVSASEEDAAFHAMQAGERSTIRPIRHGPLIAENVERVTNSRGATIVARAEMALCRCGASANKPFCDGTHARIGFVSDRDPSHTPDGVVDYRGARITVHFNKLLCAASEQCAKGLPTVFREGESPWIVPDRANPEAVVATIERCPSGALRYTREGGAGTHAPVVSSIHISRDGPYEVEAVALETDSWPQGASAARYTLCRCGASKNKPFCDGSHWSAGFKDDAN